MTTEIQHTMPTMESALDSFAARLNSYPPPAEVQSDPRGYKYLPASFIQMKLDEIFLGLWSWEVKSVQVVANEILVTGDLRVFHPVAKQWITRSGVGAALIRQMKGADITDISAKIRDAITMDLPHAETDSLKNAAKKFGQVLGRDLNRKFIDNYEQQVFTPEELEVNRLAAELQALKLQIRRALATSTNPEKATIQAGLNAKATDGSLTASDIKEALTALKAKA